MENFGYFRELAEFTQKQEFIVGYSIIILMPFIVLLGCMFQARGRIKRACKEARLAVERKGQNNSDLSDDDKRHKELVFKNNFYTINETICHNGLFKHHWSEFTEALVHSSDSSTPVRNSHSAAFFFNEDTIILPNYRAATYSACPNYFTGLGILGTFLGLAGGIYLASSGLSGGFDTENTESLRKALNQLLSGAGLAFMTSLVGLFCSLFFSVCEKRNLSVLRQSLGRFVDALDARVHLITAEDISRQQLALQEEQRDLMQSFVDHVGQNIGDAINGMFSEGMKPLMEKMVSEISSLRSDRATEAQQIISTLTNDLADKIHAAAGKEMEAFSTAFTEMHHTLVPLLEEYKESQGRGLEAAKALNDTLQQLVSVHESLHSCIQRIESGAVAFEGATTHTQKLLQATMEHATTAAEEMKTYHATILEERALQERRFEQQMLTAQEHYSIFSDTLKESLQSIDTQKNHMESAWDKHVLAVQEHYAMVKNQQTALEHSWKQYCDRFENVDTALQNTFATLTEGLGVYSKTTKEYIAGLDDHLEQATKHLHSVVRGLKEAVEEWQEMREEMDAANASIDDKSRV